MASKFEFVSDPGEELKCVICLEVAEEPYQHDKCGMLFCEGCLESYGLSKPCPYCRCEQPQHFRDSKSKDLDSLYRQLNAFSYHMHGHT